MAAAKKGVSTGKVVALGAGAATAAVAAVGAYWFYGSHDALKHRKTARSWMLKARGDVLAAVEAAVEKVGEIDKAAYMAIVDGVLKRYAAASGATSAEMTQATKDMKAAWSHMQAARKGTATKTAKKVSKKATKKANKS